MLSVEDMQVIFDISRNMAYKIVNTHDFPKIRIGSRIFIPRKEFNNWVKRYIGKTYSIN
jgi:predicted DNA-binding transcriptional regulator AlpA